MGKDAEQRILYLWAAHERGWSRAILDHRIDTDLHARQGTALTDFPRTLPPLRFDLVRQTLKDPYTFDFLTLGDYIDREPNPATEAPLVVEVSNTTLAGDRTTRAAIHARNGIAEYRVVAVPTRTLIVHRQPTAEGYAEVRTDGEAEGVSPLAAPEAVVRVAELLPSAAPVVGDREDAHLAPQRPAGNV